MQGPEARGRSVVSGEGWDGWSSLQGEVWLADENVRLDSQRGGSYLRME